MPRTTRVLTLAGLMGLARPLSRSAFYCGLLILACASLTPGTVSALFVPQDYAFAFQQNDRFDNYVGYGFLMLLAGVGYTHLRPIWIAFLSLLALGVLLEVGQLFVSERIFSLSDIMANIFGTIYGAVLWWLLRISKDRSLRD